MERYLPRILSGDWNGSRHSGLLQLERLEYNSDSDLEWKGCELGPITLAQALVLRSTTLVCSKSHSLASTAKEEKYAQIDSFEVLREPSSMNKVSCKRKEVLNVPTRLRSMAAESGNCGNPLP